MSFPGCNVCDKKNCPGEDALVADHVIDEMYGALHHSPLLQRRRRQPRLDPLPHPLVIRRLLMAAACRRCLQHIMPFMTRVRARNQAGRVFSGVVSRLLFLGEAFLGITPFYHSPLFRNPNCRSFRAWSARFAVAILVSPGPQGLYCWLCDIKSRTPNRRPPLDPPSLLYLAYIFCDLGPRAPHK